MYRTVRTVLWEVGWQIDCQPPTRFVIMALLEALLCGIVSEERKTEGTDDST